LHFEKEHKYIVLGDANLRTWASFPAKMLGDGDGGDSGLALLLLHAERSGSADAHLDVLRQLAAEQSAVRGGARAATEVERQFFERFGSSRPAKVADGMSTD